VVVVVAEGAIFFWKGWVGNLGINLEGKVGGAKVMNFQRLRLLLGIVFSPTYLSKPYCINYQLLIIFDIF